MLIVGSVILVNLNLAIPTGHTGMTEEEILDLMVRQQENQDMTTLAGILVAIGFMLVLISFGKRRTKGNAKKEEKKSEIE